MYQNVSVPRFYVDHGLWLTSTGIWTLNYDLPGVSDGDSLRLIQLNPSNKIHT